MAAPGRLAVDAIFRLMQGKTGLPAVVDSLRQTGGADILPMLGEQITRDFASIDMADESPKTKYPTVSIFCERLSNTLNEKFRQFAGKVDVTVEIRVSHDHLAPLLESLHWYVEAVTDVLDAARGEVAEGLYFGGKYDVQFTGAKKGGRRYVQCARVTAELYVSTP